MSNERFVTWPAVSDLPPVDVPAEALLAVVRQVADGWWRHWDRLLPPALYEECLTGTPDDQQLDRLSGILRQEYEDAVRSGSYLTREYLDDAGAVRSTSWAVVARWGLALVLKAGEPRDRAVLRSINRPRYDTLDDAPYDTPREAMRALVRQHVPERETPRGRYRVIDRDVPLRVEQSTRTSVAVRFANPVCWGFRTVADSTDLTWSGTPLPPDDRTDDGIRWNMKPRVLPRQL